MLLSSIPSADVTKKIKLKYRQSDWNGIGDVHMECENKINNKRKSYRGRTSKKL